MVSRIRPMVPLGVRRECRSRVSIAAILACFVLLGTVLGSVTYSACDVGCVSIHSQFGFYQYYDGKTLWYFTRYNRNAIPQWYATYSDGAGPGAPMNWQPVQTQFCTEGSLVCYGRELQNSQASIDEYSCRPPYPEDLPTVCSGY